MSIRQSIRDRAITELNAAPPTGVPQTTKRRYVPGTKLTEPRIAAFFAEEETQRVGGPGSALTSRSFILALQAIVIVEDPADADDACEPLLEHIVSIMGDTNLAGLATDVSELSTLWASANDSGGFILAAMTRWRIKFQTVKNDLSRKQ